MEKLALEEVESSLQHLDGWEISNGKWLIKKYRFKSFMESIRFVDRIAELSEQENHHPFISIDYVLVTLKLTSWQAGGITALDLELIQRYDALFTKK